MKLFTISDIEECLFISKSKIKYIIKLMGIVKVKNDKHNRFYYNAEQVELIKENNPKNYAENDGFMIYPSKLNNLKLE